jgi:uncharacterized protein YciI
LKHAQSALTLPQVKPWESNMLFVIINTARPGQLDLRMATRTAHIAYLDSKISQLIHGGAMLDADGKPCGSAIVLEAESREAAEEFAAGDPYAKAGLFESSVCRPFREVYKDGGKL